MTTIDFIVRQGLENPSAPWLRVEQHRGPDAVTAACAQVLDGKGDPRTGHMLAL